MSILNTKKKNVYSENMKYVNFEHKCEQNINTQQNKCLNASENRCNCS